MQAQGLPKHLGGDGTNCRRRQVEAFQPYAARVVEKTYDLNEGANAAPTLLATVTTDSD